VNRPQEIPPFVGRHDHDRCVERALARAESLCRERGARLTVQRRRVLELLWTSHRPIGAYEVLDMLREEGFSAAPPTVYRALDFLLGQRLIHRIESLNAFVGCDRPDTEHTGQFFVCTGCCQVAEMDDRQITRAVSRSAADVGFEPEHQTIEVSGVCRRCRKGGSGD
jgi:Fur family zinc uptake transcriptional regulator